MSVGFMVRFCASDASLKSLLSERKALVKREIILDRQNERAETTSVWGFKNGT